MCRYKTHPDLPVKQEVYEVVKECVFVEQWEEKLYNALAVELRAQADAHAARLGDLAGHRRDDILKATADVWRFFGDALRWTVGLFQYLDAAYCRNPEKDAKQIWFVGAEGFRKGMEARGLGEALVEALRLEAAAVRGGDADAMAMSRGARAEQAFLEEDDSLEKASLLP